MDNSTFDRIARALGNSLNRRNGIKAAVAAITGAAATALPAIEPAADAKKRKKR